jgi:hypothetical protein
MMGATGEPSGYYLWFIAVAARGGQTPFMRTLPPHDPQHERVEIILEYAAAKQATVGSQ